MASEEVGSGQTTADVKEEETQFPALRYDFLMQTHFFLLGNANNNLIAIDLFRSNFCYLWVHIVALDHMPQSTCYKHVQQ